MSIITDALKLAASQEKTISKQEAEIAKLKAQVEALTIAKAAADEETRIAKEALKSVNVIAKLELKEAKRVAKDALGVVQVELKEVKAQLKVAQKIPKIPKTPKLIPTNDALGQVKRKPGRPKKVVEPVESETPAVPEVDPRQMNLPDLGAPAISAEAAQPNTSGMSAKGVNYEFV